VDLPDKDARREILALILKDETLAPDVDLATLAAMTTNYSGSDLKNLCMAAALSAVRRESRAGLGDAAAPPNWAAVPVHRTLMWADFVHAFNEVKASIGDDTATLAALRKWDQQFGDSRRRPKTVLGFRSADAASS